MPLTGDLAHNTCMCPDWELNQQSFGPQAGTQSTEPHQPGQQGAFELLVRVCHTTMLHHFKDERRGRFDRQPLKESENGFKSGFCHFFVGP